MLPHAAIARADAARNPGLDIATAKSGVDNPAASDVEAARFLAEAYQQLQDELGKVIVGQERVIEEILIAIFARGHCLMQGVPGLAKTLLVSTLAQAMDLSFQPHPVHARPDAVATSPAPTSSRRTPRPAGGGSSSSKGPVFANLLLADEINRTPPKTQAALLQAMQERQVTAGSRTLDLPDPFFVLATQNPIEQEGTYPLPEAQLDRFMFMVTGELPAARRGAGSAQAHDRRRRRRRCSSVIDGRADRRAAGDRPPRAGGRPRLQLRAGPRPRHAAQRAGRQRLRPPLAELGGRAAGRAVPDPRRQGPGADARAAARDDRRHRGRRRRRCCGTASSPTSTPRPRAITVEQIIEKILTLVPRGKGGAAAVGEEPQISAPAAPTVAIVTPASPLHKNPPIPG